MRKIFVITLILLLQPVVMGDIITGGVEMSVDTAREEVVSGQKARFDYMNVKNNLTDRNYRENQSKLLKGITELNDRKLGRFSDGSYAVMYYDDPKNTYYYSPDGILTHNEVKTDTNYPFKAYKYKTDGTLENQSLKVSPQETFIFNKNGKLIAHWLGENCFDENNNIIMTRKIKG